MKKYCYIAIILVGSVFFESCKYSADKSKVTSDRDEWIESLSDSIAILEQKILETSLLIENLRNEEKEMLDSFVAVDNPCLVEGYIVFEGWQKYDTGSGTGIIARVLNNERIEIVASLMGAAFDRIEVVAGNKTVSSKIVPYDGALNYRSGNVEIVAFTEASADSVAEFIAKNYSDALELRYYGRTLSGKIKLSDSQIKMIVATWRLVSTHAELNRMERSLPLYNEKIRILKAHININD